MKLKNIILTGLSAAALASCSDYLDVDAPSKVDPEYVYSDKREMSRALNGIYASMLSKDTYGGNFMEKLCFNTDVEFKINDNEFSQSSAFQRYECDPDAGDLKKVWDNLYSGIERANMLDDGIRNSKIFDAEDKEMMQILGETKVLRAIFYHDLVWYFGDVPFSLLPSYKNEQKVYDVVDRTVILDNLIEDLKEAAVSMSFSNDINYGTEHISKEMAWAMIARLAMTAGGYSLRPEGDSFGKMMRPDNYSVNGKTYKWEDFYKTAIDYCDSVMVSGPKRTLEPFYEVFYNECNFTAPSTGDVIWEIPFGSNSSGNVGYIHGPKMDNANGISPMKWGKASGSAQLNALYRYLFEDGDVRRDYVNQLFHYTQTGEAKYNNGRTVYNGKWSKLWNKSGLGNTTEDNTGFNYPYMRYADVLLMYAEAVNELEQGVSGPNGQKAIEAYQQVRKRAFPVNDENQSNVIKQNYMGDGSYEDFRNAVLDERKFEFAGENMRWRDLVRNNLLNEKVYWTFFRYHNAADGNMDYSEAVSNYDFNSSTGWSDKLNYTLYVWENIPNNKKIEDAGMKKLAVEQFPQSSADANICYIRNPYRKDVKGDDGIKINGKKPTKIEQMAWFDDNTSTPTSHFLYSLRGYIYRDINNGMFYININGTYSSCPMPSSNPTFEELPVVRYILPYPRAVVTRSQGKYKNQYGYK